jgi:hypothetical protein
VTVTLDGDDAEGEVELDSGGTPLDCDVELERQR